MATTILIEKLKPEPCPRCKGRMLLDGASGDSSCFSCGHVLYRDGVSPQEPREKRERHPSHGGHRL